jgi:hypothetical protein
MKDAGLRIRVQRELRDRFIEACRSQDRPAAQVLREFMRSYVTGHERDRINDNETPSVGAGLRK